MLPCRSHHHGAAQRTRRACSGKDWMLNDGTRNASCGSRDCTRSRSRSPCSTRHHRAKHLGRDRAYSWDKPHCRFEQTPEKRTDARIATVASVIVALRPVVAHLMAPSLLEDELLHADLVRSERGAVTLGCRRLLPGRCFCFGLYHQTRCLLGTIQQALAARDRKSTRLNSSHLGISYAVFCLK